MIRLIHAVTACAAATWIEDVRAFSDDFERPATPQSDETSGTPAIGADYKIVEGNWRLTGDGLTAEGKSNKRLVVESQPTDASGAFQFGVDFKLDNPNDEKCSVGVMIVSDESNEDHYIRFRGGEVNLMQFISSMGDRKKVSGFDLAEVLEPGVWYRLTGEVEGGVFQFKLVRRDEPNRIVSEGTGKSNKLLGSGKVGLYASDPAVVVFDNLTVTAP